MVIIVYTFKLFALLQD